MEKHIDLKVERPFELPYVLDNRRMLIEQMKKIREDYFLKGVKGFESDFQPILNEPVIKTVEFKSSNGKTLQIEVFTRVKQGYLFEFSVLLNDDKNTKTSITMENRSSRLIYIYEFCSDNNIKGFGIGDYLLDLILYISLHLEKKVILDSKIESKNFYLRNNLQNINKNWFQSRNYCDLYQ